MNKLTSLLAAVLLLPASVMANSITDSQTITNGGFGSVGYTYFSQDATGTTSLETFTGTFDSELFLFKDDGALSLGDLITHNDDGGTFNGFSWYNSLISLTLDAGNYIAAVGAFNLNTREAVSGVNNGSRGFGDYDLVITSTANVSVPAPASIALLGLGLLCMGATRRRGSK
ncbi:MAG: hypothetical protein ACJAZP_001510 [Psychromonas sp.]|jgi:hypothetical protein|uniref:DVUA0089 family protein n=1 Tax=Psychromonas sp. TaxID=1884585 RepID=UPI0039E66583